MIKQAPQKFLREFAGKAWLRTPAYLLGIFLVSLFFAAPLTAQVTVTTLSLPGGTVGTGYSQTLVAIGGVAPYRWTVTAGALPAGLGVNTNNGDITGPPTVVGTASFTVTATDKFGLTGSQALSITIAPAPIITTTSLPGGTVGAAYSQTMAASGGTAPLTWSLSGGSLPAGLSPITGAGVIAGTPSAAGSPNFTVRVTDGAGATATKALSITVAAALSITTSALPGGTVGVAYSQSMAATGGTAPLTWSLSAGALPGGFNPITGGGAIAGTPSAAGTANFTVRVADSVGAVATKALSITIAAPPSITTGALPGGTVGRAYSQTVAATGGTAPLTFSLSAGALPAGLSPITGAGVIAGTPSAAGIANFTVRVTDGVGATATQALSITIAAAPTITTASLPGGTTGVAYSQTVTATGGTAPLTWSLSAGSLPAGLNPITSAGVIAGTPSAAGTFNFTVRVTDSAGATVTKALSITIVDPLIITTSSLPGGTVGAAYSQTVAATGGTAPLTFSLSAGALPAGLSPITGAGVIAGTPSAAGIFNFTVKVTDGVGVTATKAFSITIAAAPTITTASLPGGTVGTAYSQTMAATGGTAPLTWSLSAGALPAGLNPITSAGVIAGTPSAGAVGTANFTVRVTDGVGAVATKALSIVITPALTITTPSLSGGTVGVAYSQTVAATGGTAPLTFSLSAGALPAGLSPITSGGVIAGTPSATGTSNFTVRVTDSLGATATKAFSITIAAALSITTSALPGGTAGLAYSQTVAATGGTAPLTWSLVTGGTYPTGLNPITSGGVIAGTPSAAGKFDFTVRVTDGAGATATQALSITIAAALSITTGALPGGTAGVAYSQTAAATGGTAPLTWSLSAGALPAGFSPITSGGVIAGTPSAAGTSNFTVKVTDSVGAFATKALSITIAAVPSITTSALPGGTAGTAYSQTVAATGGTAPLTWTLSAGALPAGLNPIASDGAITGTPSVAGTSNFTVKVTDSVGASATKDLSITIAAPLAITISALPGGTAGTPYSQAMAATGGTAPLTWSLSAGALPAGLSPITSGGVIAGTPSAAGTSNFTVKVTDGAGAAATKALSITIAGALAITTLPDGTAGTPYSQTVAATGGTAPLTWSLSAGALPPGFSPITSGGVIAGMPSDAGTSNFTVRVTDSVGATVTRAVSIRVALALAITTSALTNGHVGSVYSATLAATGGTSPYTWADVGGLLPDGLSLNTTTGVISGKPTMVGLFSFVVQVSDSGNPARTKFQALSVTVGPALLITTTLLQGGNVASSYSQIVTSTGDTPPLVWSITAGSLPPGLKLNSATGEISGVPTTAGISSFTVRVTDSSVPDPLTASRDLSINIDGAAGSGVLKITTSTFPSGTVGIQYAQSMSIAGGVLPYTLSVVGAGMPPGLTLSPAGVLSGTPTEAGTFGFSVKVTDSATPAQTDTKPVSITIIPSLSITTASLPGGDVGAPYTTTLIAAGGAQPYAWSVTGVLPGGLSLNSATGTISGTPNAVGTFDFRINVADAVSRTTFKNFEIAVGFPKIQISIPATSQPAQQTPLDLTLSSPFPTSLSGQLTLTFLPNATVPIDDPMLQFSNGTRTANFTIAANSTTAVFSPPVMMLTGTVAGTVRIGATFVNGPMDLTAGTSEIAAAAPQFNAVEATITSSTIVVRVTGYSVIRSVTSVTFGFDVRTASGIQRVNYSRNVDSDFGTWYQNPQSAAYGSLFVFSQTLNVQGDASTIEAVVVTLTNAKGSQTSVSTPLVRK